MKTLQCNQCNSVMGLLKETPRWKLYKCFSCRHVMGRIREGVTQQEIEDATMEMDAYAGTMIGEEFQSMGQEERQRLFEHKDTDETSDNSVQHAETQAKGRRHSSDWIHALQSYGFLDCRILGRKAGQVVVECVGELGTYRAFVDTNVDSFILQWITGHPVISQLNEREKNQLVKLVIQASSNVELEFNENMARVRVHHIGIPKDYDSAFEQLIHELKAAIPILLSKIGSN